MRAASPTSPRRYRRRILALGALAFVTLFIVGAVIFIPMVQNDLEDRVEAALGDNAIDGVTASFSGQDGTLYCAQVLDDPARAVDLASGLWGVRVIRLDRTCSGDGTSATASTVPPVSSGTTAADSDEGDTDTVGSAPTEPEADSIADVIAGDPLFGQLAELVTVAGLDGEDGLGGEGPFTLLAPTDAAFDAAFEELGADAFGALTSDPELLRKVLLHHAVAGRIDAASLQAGPLEMLDGTTVTVDPDAVTFSSGDSVAGVADPETQLDIEASNGIVHAIDRLLIPADVDLRAAVAQPTTVVELVTGRVILSGVVTTAGQRDRLVAAAADSVDPANVVDELEVDAAVVTQDADIERLAALVSAVPPTLVAGTVTLVASDLTVTGTALDDDTAALLEGVATNAGATIELDRRAQADTASAAELQTELNDFVSANPVLFEQSSTALSPAANAVIEQLAARALRLEGTAITVIGHTDTDGSSTTNQQLSDGRAASVVAALVAQGVPADSLTSQGRGESSPILDAAGVEDKEASRRVEFVVEAS